MDRDNPLVADLYEPHHPAVLLALRRVAREARRCRKPSAVCGDLAGDPAFSLLLLGMGFEAVSVAPHFVPEIKYAVRRTPLAVARDDARAALAQNSPEGVREVLARIRDRLYDQDSDGRSPPAGAEHRSGPLPNESKALQHSPSAELPALPGLPESAGNPDHGETG